MFYEGVIEDIKDPLMLCRVKVRVYGIHTESLNELPTKDLPWATVLMPTTSASLSGIGQTHGLLQGSWVMVFFRDGNEKQEPVVMGSIHGIESKPDPSENKGFRDPDNEFPRKEYYGLSSASRMANYVVATDKQAIDRDKNRKKKIKVANSPDVFEEPATPHLPAYPNNLIHVSKSGHVNEIDDTAGAERLLNQHRSGTYEEIHANGTRVVKVIGDGYEIYARHNTVHVGGYLTLTVEGNAHILVEKNAEVQVNGNMNTVVNGDMTSYVAKNRTDTVLGDYVLNIQGSMETNVIVDHKTTVKGNREVNVEKDSTESIQGLSKRRISTERVYATELQIAASGTFKLGGNSFEIGANNFVLSATSPKIYGETSLNIHSGGVTVLDGSIVRLGEGGQAATSPEFE